MPTPEGSANVSGPAAGPQTTQQRSMSVKIDEKDMRTTYSNAFRTHTTAEETLIDFGVNLIVPAESGKEGKDENQILFQVSERLILNYFTVKRLAIALSQIVRMHEEQFGAIELDAGERMKKK